jgi:hypothetical protein
VRWPKSWIIQRKSKHWIMLPEGISKFTPSKFTTCSISVSLKWLKNWTLHSARVDTRPPAHSLPVLQAAAGAFLKKPSKKSQGSEGKGKKTKKVKKDHK